MSRLFDALEICLQEIERGADLETALRRFPDLAAELRPLLQAALAAKRLAAPHPPQETVLRVRARILQRSAELRGVEAKRGAMERRPRPFFLPFTKKFAVAFSVIALLLTMSGLGGIGIVTASASALPDERLYPVKRSWENLRLIFAFDPNARAALETQFYYERLSEVTTLLAEGRIAPVEFAGIYLQTGGQIFVSGIHVAILNSTALPQEGLQNGDAVLVFGTTTLSGIVQANAIQLLPNPSLAPPANPYPLPAPTIQAAPSPSPQTPAVTATPTPSVQPATIVPQPTQPPTNNDNRNSNQNNNDDDDDNDNDDDDDNDNDDDDDDDD